LLSQTGTKVLGSILNKLTDEVSGYYGYYGYQNRYYGSYLDAEASEEDSKAMQSVK
jgi:Mrp family chromosome partitioning ATPase